MTLALQTDKREFPEMAYRILGILLKFSEFQRNFSGIHLNSQEFSESKFFV